MSVTESPLTPRVTTVNTRRLPGARAILALMLREMTTAYGRSPGGYVWAIASPVAMVLILTAVFTIIMRSPPLGTSFPFFYATGYLPFVLFLTMTYAVAGSIRYSRQLLKFPAVTWVDAIAARSLLALLTSSVIFLIVLPSVMVVFSVSTVFDPKLMLLAWVMIAVLGLGIGAMNCYIVGTFPAWESAWQILTRPLFFVSGIIFLPENMPPWVGEIILWNPVSHGVLMMRRGTFPTYAGDYISVVYPLAVGGFLLLLGLILIRRNYQAILNG